MRNIVFIVQCLVLFTAISVSCVYAGPPFVTDDPEPLEAQQWEINYAFNKTWSDGGYTAALPALDINYGYSTDLQLHIQPKYSFVGDTAEVHRALDNTEIGMKYRMIDRNSEDSKFMVGIYPMVQLPAGDKRLSVGSGNIQSFLPIWTQYTTREWTFYGGMGYRFNHWENSKNSTFIGTVISYQITPVLSLGGELFNESETSIGEKGTAGFNIGGSYNISERYHFLFSAGKGIHDVAESNKLSLYIALQTVY